ncbi:XRE family transcriptional regulator [Geothermobacter ehrlichii]|uniref:XRE family transcriptional regulator n=1 Tax=Geothermobacter ehrlichii TaxID=213224 RepID=A0A5D3WMD9_9BACT|nr:cupin domain-containing protein [Geothermobacter ehrlichii]TYO98488.1 XRE family transcriptional regulator [Geothermobacter ehrlichii]
MNDIREEVKELQIGLKVRRLRQNRRMTLQDLADQTGLSKPLLSQIENDQVIPPLATLLRISKAFKVRIENFFQEESASEKCILVRSGESRKLIQRGLSRGGSPPYIYHSLAYGKRDRNIEPFLMEFQARNWEEGLLVSHEGQEFLYLLEGEVEFRYGDRAMHLKAGDSLFYDSNEPHGYIAVSETPPRAIVVLYSREA